MKTFAFLLISSVFVCFSFLTTASEKSENDTANYLKSFNPADINLKGYTGEKINLCISERIKKQDVDALIEPFRYKKETKLWQSEFWGKWMLSAVAAWKYRHDPEIMQMMKHAVEGLLETQLDNGYIGNYAPESQLTQWDIWGRKYSMLGLIKYFEITKDTTALKAARRVADHLLTQVGPGKKDIIFTGNFRGMASSSVLEPIVYLYNHTRDKQYLDFAEYIVTQWETPDGPKLISNAIEGVPVSERFPHPKEWWSWENGQKAYEMMSCYEGLLQLYRVTQNEKYLEAVTDAVDNIIQTEINVAGSGTAFECWYHGKENQAQPTYHTMETCVTMTWMKLCYSLLQVTGNPKYADQVEKTFYNALLASMKFDGSEIAKYSPLEGVRHAGEEQCGMHINCCVANGPRGFTLMPAFAYLKSEKGIFIEFYNESFATFYTHSGNPVRIIQTTEYPEDERIKLEIQPEKPEEFEINLRIPEWSERSAVTVNGQNMGKVKPGNYFTIKRTWNPDDKIMLILDLRGRLVKLNNHQSITRGPVVLARDSRFDDGYVDEAAVIQNENGIVKLIHLEDKPKHVWMAFTAPLVLGTDLEGVFREPRRIAFCDFSSAGNTWDENTRYLVWIRETLNLMEPGYKKY